MGLGALHPRYWRHCRSNGRAVMGIMGWSNSAMAVRYQHMTDQVRRDLAQQLGGLLWGDPPRRPGETGDGQPDGPEQGK